MQQGDPIASRDTEISRTRHRGILRRERWRKILEEWDPNATELIEALGGRPSTRQECPPKDIPCPFVGCKYHLYLDVIPETGTIKLNYPEIEPHQMKVWCVLNFVEQHGSATLQEVGDLLQVTRERIRQVESKAKNKLIRSSIGGDGIRDALF